ncbi:hypothetical protein K432DRAFT_297478 [Lepidopterella palustris CBS 459.81]|uniref:BZIP domain-containing protein n=1 Tax=Lepidopterella palustris CBS 459.81 TaxID=1314670 RepID=A0A8E2EAL1_9PEZI|nr:hypothetical protein K432DRAFT_297478 [Lepidopterella palustris CBS 459.81]
MDFHRPSSTLSVDRKPSTFSFDDNVTLDSNILDTPSIMSPTNSTQGMFSPDNSLWEDYPGPFVERTTNTNNNNPFFEQNNNPFTRLPATQAATYGQQPSAWQLGDSSGARTPTAPKTLHTFGQGDFDSGPPSSFLPVGSHLSSAFGGLPLHTNVRPSSVFPSAQPEQPLSPHSNTEWMALTQQELESRPGPKRMRPNTPPRSFSPRRDGIRKKNARFDIPPERSLLNIDLLIQNSTNDEEIKELKQQKRLLRNRQAALDSRQRKKKHTEELEEEKKLWTERVSVLDDEISNLRLQIDGLLREKEQWHHEKLETRQIIDQLQWDKEELVRTHTLETGELRKKVSVLTEKLESSSTAMSVAPSSTFTDFASDMDNLNMGPNDWDNYIFVNDFCMDESTPSASQHTQQQENTLVVAPRKKDSEDKPVASGLLLMLLLCGAFVASKSSGSSAPPLPRMPDDVRAASATVLDSIFKDAGVSASPSQHHALIANRVESLEPAPSGASWHKRTLSGAEFASLSHGSRSNLDQLHHHLVAPTKDQEAEQLFSITPSQYNSLTSADFTRRGYSVHSDDMNDPLSPGSQPSHHRRNLAETLAAMREESKGETAAEVYTRSLLWERIPSEVVHEFKRMVEESDRAAASNTGDGEVHKVEVGG